MAKKAATTLLSEARQELVETNAKRVRHRPPPRPSFCSPTTPPASMRVEVELANLQQGVRAPSGSH